MQQAVKQRLVGAAVLAGLAVIFLPLLLDDSALEKQRIEATNIPPRPGGGEFTSRIIPLDTEPAPVAPQEVLPAASPRAPEGLPQAAPPAAGKEAPLAPRTGVIAWVVQLGSFTSEQKARELEKRLRQEGYSAFVERLYFAEGKRYRVRVGPELARDKAEATRERIEKELDLKGFVVRYP